MLTPAGEALTPIVWAMGHWAAEWMFGDPTEDDCDGLSLIWRTHQHAIPARLPQARTVVHVVLTGPGGAEGWLDIERPAITVCKDDQGLDVDLAVEADTAQMHRWLTSRPGSTRRTSQPGWPVRSSTARRPSRLRAPEGDVTVLRTRAPLEASSGRR